MHLQQLGFWPHKSWKKQFGNHRAIVLYAFLCLQISNHGAIGACKASATLLLSAIVLDLERALLRICKITSWMTEWYDAPKNWLRPSLKSLTKSMKFTGADALLLKLRARIVWNFFELSSWRVWLNFLCDQRRSLSLHQSLLNTRGWTYDRHNEPSLWRKWTRKTVTFFDLSSCFTAVQCLHALLFVKACRLPLANTRISPGIDGDGNGQFGGDRNPSQRRTRRWTIWSHSHPISANASLAAEANVKPHQHNHQQNRLTSPITTNPSTRKCCLSL